MWSLVATGLTLAMAIGPQEDGRIRVLILSGANNHDWEWTTPSLARILQESGRFDVDISDQPAVTLLDSDGLARYDALLLDYNGPRWGEPAESHFLEAVRSGTGTVVIHAADNAFPGWVEYETLVGLLWRDGTGHGSFHPFDVRVIDHDHPLTWELPDLISHSDELYHRLLPMHGAELRVLATAYSDPATGGTGLDEPMIIVGQYGEGRVFHTPLGHVWKNVAPSRVSHEDPQFRRLVCRGTEWAASGTVAPNSQDPNALSEKERAQGYRALFDGSSTEGWRGYRLEGFPESGWTVDDHCLHVEAAKGGGDLISADPFTDFELCFEFKVAAGANSGVMIRVDESQDASWMTGPEYQVLDDRQHPDDQNSQTSTASLYGLYVAEGANPYPAGQFNEARIVARGKHIEHWLNGRLVVECELGSEDWTERVARSKFATLPQFAQAASGHIVLQDHGDDVWYRSLKIRPWSGEERP